MRFRYFEKDDKKYYIDNADLSLKRLLLGPIRIKFTKYDAYEVNNDFGRNFMYDFFIVIAGFFILMGVGKRGGGLATKKVKGFTDDNLIFFIIVIVGIIIIWLFLTHLFSKKMERDIKENTIKKVKVKVNGFKLGGLIFIQLFIYIFFGVAIYIILSFPTNPHDYFFAAMIIIPAIVIVGWWYLFHIFDKEKQTVTIIEDNEIE